MQYCATMTMQPFCEITSAKPITKDMLDWLFHNIGSQGMGWWRNGHDRIRIAEPEAAVEFYYSFTVNGLSIAYF